MPTNQLINITTCLLLILFAPELSTAQKPELVVQTGHHAHVGSVAFSPDGKMLVSVSGDYTVKLWDVATGQELRTFNVGFGVGSAAFSPDGKSFATDGGGNDSIKLWDVASGRKLRTFTGESGGPIVFSPDGKTLAASIHEVKGNEGYNSIGLWDVATGRRLSTFTLLPNSLTNSISFSFNGATLIGASGNTIKLWEVATGRELRTLSGIKGEVFSDAFSRDGRTLVSVMNTFANRSWSSTVKLWEIATGRELRTLSRYDGEVLSNAFSPDGRTLVSVINTFANRSWSSTVKLWEIATGRELRALTEQNSEVTSVRFSSDSKTLVIVMNTEDHSTTHNTTRSTIKLREVATGRELGYLTEHSNGVTSVGFGKTLAVGFSGGNPRFWDPARGLLLPRPSWNNLSFSDLIRMLATDFRKYSEGPGFVWFSPDGATLAMTAEGGGTQLWDVAHGQVLRTIPGPISPNGDKTFSPDSKILANGGGLANTITLWDVATGRELRTLITEHEGGIYSIAYSPNGKVLASGAGDSTIKLWDVSTGRELHTLAGHTNVVSDLAFSPDGEILASGSWDQTIKLWEVATGRELSTLTGHSYAVYAVAFSADGKTLASGSGDATVKLWEISTSKLLASLIAFDETDWMVVTPDGLFDGSQAAWNKIIWRFNNNTFDHAPVEAFFSDFYYPGLLADISAGKRPQAPSDISQKDRRQPQLRVTVADSPSDKNLTQRSLKVKVDISESAADTDHKTGGGAQDVRLFRNGSLVKVWRDDVLKGKSSVTLEATIPIVAGGNRLTAYAFNHDNIKSSDATLTVNGADSLKRQGTLHIFAVGVGKYANSNYNLNYTTDDATSFAAQLKLEQEKIGQYKSVEVTTLLNEKATKQNIVAELKQLASNVQPEDSVVVYFSGHGKADGDHFYLIPHDLGYSGPRDQLTKESLRRMLPNLISDVELEEAFRGIDAGQMFMIIDACNSGQALENKDEPRRGPMNTRGLAQLAYEKGMYIMTASQNVEEAFVSEKLKHSYLTYALVEEGLKTKSADQDHDGQVTLREWFDYASTRVPKLRDETLQSKSLDEVTPTVTAARAQKTQTPRQFYRREQEAQPFVVVKP